MLKRSTSPHGKKSAIEKPGGRLRAMRTLAMAGTSGGRTLMKTGKAWSMLKEDTTMEGVAGAALYLLSDLGKSCTGEVLHVDAGFHAVAVPDIEE